MSKRPVTPATFARDALALHRLTRLVTEDAITQPLRDRLILRQLNRHADSCCDGDVEQAFADADLIADRGGDPQELIARLDNPPKLATLITCRWCASVHVAMLAVCLRRVAPRWWNLLAEVMALSAAGTLIARLEE